MLDALLMWFTEQQATFGVDLPDLGLLLGILLFAAVCGCLYAANKAVVTKISISIISFLPFLVLISLMVSSVSRGVPENMYCRINAMLKPQGVEILKEYVKESGALTFADIATAAKKTAAASKSADLRRNGAAILTQLQQCR